VNFIVSKQKENYKDFEKDKSLSLFDQCFEEERRKMLLWRIGFTDEQTNTLRENHQDKIEAFRKVLDYFENVKTANGETKVSDGIDHPPVFWVRHILRELPDFFSRNFQNGEWAFMPVDWFCEMMAVSYVDQKDLTLSDSRKLKALEFQQSYRDLICVFDPQVQKNLESLVKRAAVINYPYRSTGDGLVWVINEAIAARDQVKREKIQEALDRFIESQVLIPEKWKPIEKDEIKGSSIKARLLRKMQEHLEFFDEKI